MQYSSADTTHLAESPYHGYFGWNQLGSEIVVRTPPSPPSATDGVATSSQSSFVLLNCSSLRLKRVSMIYQICIKHLPSYKNDSILKFELVFNLGVTAFQRSDTLKPASATSASDTARRSRISFYLSADPPNHPTNQNPNTFRHFWTQP